MARHKRDYCGEQFTAYVHFKCTPSQRREVIAAARDQSASISDFTREIVFAHLGTSGIAVASRPDAETDAKIRAMQTATHAVNALGNLMNQIARHVHTIQDLGPFAADLREAIRVCDHVADQLLAATEKLIAA